MATVKIVCEKTKDNDQGFVIIEEVDLKDSDELFGKPKKEKPVEDKKKAKK